MSVESVIHDVEHHRFYMVVDDPEGQVAELEYNVVDAKTLDFCHTHVPASQRGKGLADVLCDAAYAYADSNQLTVIPGCTYIANKYLAKRGRK